MAHSSEETAVLVIAAVAALAATLTLVSLGAWRKNRNPKLLFLVAAFSLFFIKGLATAWAILYHRVAHEHLELIGSVFDLAIVALLVAPLLRR